MKITLPKPAEEYLNKKADEFLMLLRPPPDHKDRPKRSLSSSYKHIDLHLTAEQVGQTLLSGTVDGFGNDTSRFFPTPKGSIGLVASDYSSFESLVEQIANRSEIKPLLSNRYVADTLFHWFEGRYIGKLSSSDPFVSFLLNSAETDIKNHRVAIPLSNFVIEKSFTLGNVLFDFYTSDFFDNVEKTLTQRNPRRALDDMKRLRQEYQGVVFAITKVNAEQERCIEVATEETEKALAVLRFFSPTMFWPQIRSYFGRLGHSAVPTNNYWVFDDGQIPEVVQQLGERGQFNLTVETEFLELIKQAGLDSFGELISNPNPNDFEQLFLNSLFILSKSVTSTDFQDKIVFALASLET
ncbi:MAG: hypothetical protein WBD36_02425, partial [Bacteroidota bacterium]